MAMLQCEIATPERQLFSGRASMVEIPGYEGSFGVLPGHELLSTLILKGRVVVFTDEARSQKIEFAAFHGYAQVHEDKVIVLAQYGAKADDIDTAAVSEQLSALKQEFEALSEEDKAVAKAFSVAQGAPDGEAPTNLAGKAVASTILDDIDWCELQLAVAGN